MEKSIAKIIYVFGELTKIEAAISTVIAKSKVPTKDIRTFLRSTSTVQCERTPLFQYIRSAFTDIELGHLRCVKVEPYSIVLGVYKSKIPGLFSDTKGKTCYVTADAIKMFFEKDMDINAEVKETMCVNDGADHCEFTVNMYPTDVLKYVIDEDAFQTLRKLKDGGKIEPDNEMSMALLQRYGLVDEQGVTILGDKYLELGGEPIVREVDRPWKKLSEVSEVTASAKSFAEAFSRSVDQNVEEVDEELVVNIVEETEKSKSFAELVAKFMKKGGENNE